MKTAFLFAGQGSQKVGMAKEFYDTFTVSQKRMDGLQCDYDLKRLCFEGPQDQLDDTAYAQSAIVAASLTILEALKEKGIQADGCAGLSLGEYTALCAAQSFDPQTAIDIVRQRGILMAQALPAGTTGMAAVLALDENAIQEVCQIVTRSNQILEIANYNCPGQIVVTGHKEAIEQATPLLLEKGARRVLPLSVSGAFHSSLLIPASEKLEAVLRTKHFALPKIPVYHNISGQVESIQQEEDLIQILKKQICQSVRFEQTIRQMIKDGFDTFVEIGPGKSLSGFVRKVSKDVQVYTINTVQDLEGMVETWNR